MSAATASQCYVRHRSRDGLRHRSFAAGAFDLIVANILAGPLAQLAPAIAQRLRTGRIAVLSGLLPTQQRWIRRAYRDQGLVVAAPPSATAGLCSCSSAFDDCRRTAPA